MRHFPIGFDDFAKLVHKKGDEYFYHFADKSLLIKDILSSTDDVILFARPRRFGKTMNMSMLQYFFDIRYAARNRDLFVGLKIAEPQVGADGIVRSYLIAQGQYPVIFVTFKDCVFNTFAETYGSIKSLLRDLYGKHDYLLESSKLKSSEKDVFRQILSGTAENEDYNKALQLLCQYLTAHYGRKVIVLIDEYDAPFQMALHKYYYDDLQPMMRALVGGVLKGNEYLEKAVLTGILRIAGAGIFSGANNVSAYTVLDERFSKHFGFSEEEIEKMLDDMERDGIADAKSKLAPIREWYNGYQFGQEVVYNPWSTMMCFSRGFDFSSHWGISADRLLHDKFLETTDGVRMNIGELMAQRSVQVIIYKDLRFDSPLTAEQHIWTLLLSAGYLKATATVFEGDTAICRTAIPNKEVSYIYIHLFQAWITQVLGERQAPELIESLLAGDIDEFGESFKRMYLEAASIRDVSKHYIEAFYHGMIFAVIGLSMGTHESKYEFLSNRESGLGYFDLMLKPRTVVLDDPRYNTGIILELKRTINRSELKLLTSQGLVQAKSLQYATELQRAGIQKIVVIGMAFCGKEIEYVYERLPQPFPTLTLAQLSAVHGYFAGAKESDVEMKSAMKPT